MRKSRNLRTWNELNINFNRKVFSVSLFKSKFNKFWKSIEENFSDNNHMFILFKIKYVDGTFVTIGPLQNLNWNDKDWYFDFIIQNMEFKSEYYNETQISEIIFSHGFRKGKILDKENTNINFSIIDKMLLPASSDFQDFGTLVDCVNENIFILQNKNNETVIFSKFPGYNEVKILKQGKQISFFRDEIKSESEFVRTIGNKKYHFKNKEQILFTKEIKTKFISKSKKDKVLTEKFLTLDIETFVNKQNILIPFCVSVYDGIKVTNFYLSNFNSVDNMMLTALKSIMIRKYNNYNVYMHNMAKFDIIFLFKYLVKLGIVKPIIHNDRIISINFNFEKKYRLTFKDSLLLLLMGLDKLSKSFKVTDKKYQFPIFYVNENNLNYVGEVPDIKFFKNTNQNEYTNYKTEFNSNWNLKNEAIKYCNLDCISLHQVLLKFSKMIFELFKKNIHKYPTLPSLAYAIFKSNFMDKENIPQLVGKIEKDIKAGYTGGAVDMYIPELKTSEILKCYDVNSLYPSQMQSQLMPVGKPVYFEGNILDVDPDAFGFFYCKIKAPDDILHPILQTRFKTKNGVRTISPIGTWKDMLFSLEMKNAIKYGYKIEILNGYLFKPENIFKNYIDFIKILAGILWESTMHIKR